MSKTGTMAAVGYARVSTDEQASSGVSMDDQRTRIGAYAALRGLTVRIIEDAGVSGGKPLATRPGGAALLRAVAARQASHVIVLKLDRGFRNAGDCLATVEDWERRGVALHVVDLGGNAIDTASAAGKFMLTILAGAAEMERNLTRERTRSAMHVKRQRAERISRHAPFGFRLARAGGLEIDPDEAQAARRMTALRERGQSLRQIAAALTDEGFRSRAGGAISPKTVRAVLRRDEWCPAVGSNAAA